MPPLNRLRQVLEQAYSPQLSSQRYRTVLTPEEEELLLTPEYNPSSAPPDRLGPVSDAVNSVLGESRRSELEGLRNRMEEEGRPDTPAWRTAAAIGSSFLAPLRAAGVPKMLAVSPEQLDWDQRNKNRMSILEQEYGLEQEGIKQRGAAANTLAKEGADVYKVQSDGNYHLDPVTMQRTQVMKPGEKMVTRGSDGRVSEDALNRAPMTYDPNQVFVDESRNVTMPYIATPTGDSRTLLYPGQYGGYATTSPGADSRDATERYVEDLKGRFSREVANIKAGADVNSARIQAGASMYGADRRLSGEQLNANSRVQAAAIRGAQGGGADPVSRARQTALKNFFDSVQRTKRDLFKDGAPTDPAEVQRGLLLLRNAFDTYKGGIEDIGGAVGDVDLEQIYNDIQQNSGWFGGSSMDPSSVAMAFELATSQAIQALGPQAPATPLTSSYSSAVPAEPPIVEVSPQQLQQVGDPEGKDFRAMRDMFPDRSALEILQAIERENRRAGLLQDSPAVAASAATQAAPAPAATTRTPAPAGLDPNNPLPDYAPVAPPDNRYPSFVNTPEKKAEWDAKMAESEREKQQWKRRFELMQQYPGSNPQDIERMLLQ